MLKDTRRSQHGGVLSGVLIITAFVAILAGALMTELSGHLVLSDVLINQARNEATMNSAAELAISQLQSTKLDAPCPAPAGATLNQLSAAAVYTSCWATVREPQKVVPVGGSGQQFNVDGTHVRANGLDDYLAGDRGGTVYDVPFGWSSPRWILSLGGTVTATPLAIPMPGSQNQLLDVVPFAGAGCSGPANCLIVRLDTAGSSSPPAARCLIPATGGVIASQPAASPTQAGLVYYGDGTLLEANDVSGGGSGCDSESSATIPNSQQVTAGPIAYRCTSGCGNRPDIVYAVAGDAGSSRLLHFEYSTNGSLNYVDSLALPWPNASGLAVSSSNLPANVAITFAGGGIALVHVTQTGGMSLTASTSIAATIMDAPYWCRSCAGSGLIGVGGEDGGLHLYDTTLAPYAVYFAGADIKTAPQADGAGNWYFGASDGQVHEVQVRGGQAVQVDSFGSTGQPGGAVQVGSCPIGLCIYLGADTHIYLVPLDARRAVISACVSSAFPSCSGTNPRLWASVEVGTIASPQTVHIEGWSYYSG